MVSLGPPPQWPRSAFPAAGAVSAGLRLIFDALDLPYHSCFLNDSHCVSHNGSMNETPPLDPRRRLRELLSIPERDRTDEQWDEIIEIEITLAPGNRESDRPLDRQPDRQQERRQGSPGTGRRPEQRKSGPRPPGPRPEPRPPAARPEAGSDAQPDRSPDARPPKRHVRRPRRTPETPGDS